MAENGVSNELMVDIGCGSGQSTIAWSNVFRKCVGTDISGAQIDCAKKSFADKENVEFKVCSSDSLPLSDGSVDLVTCGQAWHWLDHATTIPELKRVLKPRRACVAIYGYGRGEIKHLEAEKLLNEFYLETLNGYWHENRKHVDQMYRELPMVHPTAVHEVFRLEKTLSFSEFFGYLGTWSGYLAYKKKNPDNHPLETLQGRIQELIKDDCIEITLPYFLYLSKND